MMHHEKKILLAKALFFLALAAAVISAFQDWELVQSDWLIDPKNIERSYKTVVTVLSYGTVIEYQLHQLPPIGYVRMLFMASMFFYLVHLILLLFLLGPIFLARMLSYSRILWWLWLISCIFTQGLMIYIYQKHSPYVFITALGSGYLGQPHISWLSGFYFGCAALFLHLCAMLILFFPLRKKPTA